MKINRTHKFSKSFKALAKKYKNIVVDYAKLLDTLSSNNRNATDLGDNFYNIRLQSSSNNQGKSAGFRVVYFFKTAQNKIYLLDIYSKNDIKTIDKQQLLCLVKAYEL